MKTLIPILVCSVSFALTIVGGGDFIDLRDFQITGNHGIAVSVSPNGFGIGYGFSTSSYIYSEVKRGMFKLRIRTGWEGFSLHVTFGKDWSITSSYRLKSFSLGVSDSHISFSVSPGSITFLTDSLFSIQMFGFGIFSRSLKISRKFIDLDMSMSAFKYLDLSLGMGRISGNGFFGFFVPTNAFKEGFLVGFGWDDGISFGMGGRFVLNMGSIDPETFWLIRVIGDETDFGISISTSLADGNFVIFFGNRAFGVMVHE